MTKETRVRVSRTVRKAETESVEITVRHEDGDGYLAAGRAKDLVEAMMAAGQPVDWTITDVTIEVPRYNDGITASSIDPEEEIPEAPPPQRPVSRA